MRNSTNHIKKIKITHNGRVIAVVDAATGENSGSHFDGENPPKAKLLEISAHSAPVQAVQPSTDVDEETFSLKDQYDLVMILMSIKYDSMLEGSAKQ